MVKARYNHGIFTPLSSTAEFKEGEVYDLKVVRSDEHFNYFWKCMQVLGDEIGYSADDMKELLFIEVFNFTVIVENKKTGKQYIKGESVANGISKKRMNEIMKEVEKFYDEHGYIMPKKGLDSN